MINTAATKAQTKAVTEFLKVHSNRITHIVVAHTRYKTYERSDTAMQHIVEKAKQDCRYFRNCLNKALFGGNLARRKPLLYQPLLIATLEGALINSDCDLTLHYNFAIGNLPQRISNVEFQNLFRECWVDKAKQRDNIWHDTIAGDVVKADGWLGYSLKEAQSSGNVAVWDFENTQIPYAAFDAG